MKKRTVTKKSGSGICNGLLKWIMLFVAFLTVSVGVQAQSFPFPQNYKYPYGITATNADANGIQAIYKEWKAKYYEESGTKARIKFLQPGETGSATVSEGIGYGMLIMVYMDNATNATKSCFDKLYNYYMASLDGNGLMNWKMNAFTGTVIDANAAPDADLDVAQALLLAAKQWNDDTYKQKAFDIIDKIYAFEIQAYSGFSGKKLVKPGDMFSAVLNPSYFITNALKLFAQAGHSKGTEWNTIAQNHYDLVNICQNQKTGLVPDWVWPSGALVKAGDNLGDACGSCTADATGVGAGKFESYFLYDAIRVPWRFAQAYAWYGDADAKTIVAKFADWVNSALNGAPQTAKDGYRLDGTLATGLTSPLNNKGMYSNACFTGGLGISAMVDSKYQTLLNTTFSETVKSEGANGQYFTTTTQLLYLLCMTGNMPNFWDMNPTPNKAYNNSTGGCSSVYVEFNKPMNSATVSTTGWTVTMDNANTPIPITVSSAALQTDKKTIKLTLDAPTEEPLIEVAYSGTTLKSADGKTVAAFSGLKVTDNLFCARPYAMTAATNIYGDTVKIVFSKPMLPTSYTLANFSIKVNSTNVTPLAIFEDPTDPTLVQLKIAGGTVAAKTDVITVTYTAGTLKSEDGGAPKSFTSMPVINNFLTETCNILETFSPLAFAWTTWTPGTNSTSTADPAGGTNIVDKFTRGTGASGQYVSLKGDLPKATTSDSTLNVRLKTAYLLKMRLRADKAGAIVRVRLQDRYKGDKAWETAISAQYTCAAAATWYDVVFDFNTQKETATHLNEISIEVAPEVVLTTAQSIWVDDIKLCEPSASTSIVRGNTNIDGTQVRVKFNTTMAIPTVLSDFTVTAGAVDNPVTAVTLDAVDKSTLIFTVTNPFISTDVITMSYSGTSAKGLNGLKLAAFTNQKIVNLTGRAVAYGWEDRFDDATDFFTTNVGGGKDGTVTYYTWKENVATPGTLAVTTTAKTTIKDYVSFGPSVTDPAAAEVWDLTADQKVRFRCMVPSGNTVYVRADLVDLVNARSTDAVPAIKLTADGAYHDYVIDFAGNFVNKYGGANAGDVDKTNIVACNLYIWKNDGSSDPDLWAGVTTFDNLSVGKTIRIYGNSTSISVGASATAKATIVGEIYIVPGGTPRIAAALMDSVKKGVAVKASVTTADAAVTIATTKLVAGYYDLYAYDPATGEVSRKAGTGLTIVDNVPPVITQASSGNYSPGDPVTVTVNEGATVYMVLVGTAKTTAAIKTAALTSVGVSAGVTELLTIPGTVTTGDQLMFYAIDYNDNISTASTPVIKIVDVKAPVFTANTKGSVKKETGTITATINETGVIYLLQKSQVASVTNAASIAPLATASKAASAGTGISFPCTGGTPDIAVGTYVLYAVDAAGNIAGPTDDISVELGCVVINAVDLIPATLTLNSGDKATVKYSISDPVGAPAASIVDVTWAVGDEQKDPVTIVKNNDGTCDVTALDVIMPAQVTLYFNLYDCTGGDPISASMNITINPVVKCPSAISLNPTTLDLKVGATGTLTPTITGTLGTNTVMWSTASSTTATVTGSNTSATVTGAAIGQTTITASLSCNTNTKATATINVVKTPVTGVTVTPLTTSIEVGSTANATAVVAPLDATVKTVKWTTSDPKVATVNAVGVISAIGVGTCTITVTSDDDATKYATVAVTVTPVHVTSITLTPSVSTTMTVGANLTVSAVVKPDNATDASITWTSSDVTIATVTGGIVTALKAGSVTITATSKQDPTIKATLDITISDVLPTAIAINPTGALSVNVGASIVLSAAVTPKEAADKTVKWSSSDVTIATVDQTGKVTGVKAGSVVITATSNAVSTLSATSNVTVSTVPVTAITLNPSTAQTMTVGDKKTITPIVDPNTATDPSITWSSSDITIATVANGVVTALKAGSVTITATSVSTPAVTASVSITISDILPASVTINPTGDQTVDVGGSLILSAIILPQEAADKTIIWSSSDETVATVDQTGKVSGLKAGSATITATSKVVGTVTATSKVTVKNVLVSTITVTPSTLTLIKGQTSQLSASVLPNNATLKTYTWSSSDPAVVTVDANGNIKAVSIGVATISATASDASGVKGSCTVTVNPVLPVSIAASDIALLTAETTGKTISYTFTPDTTTDKSVTFVSADPSIATVDANGLVVPVGVGSTTVTITSKALNTVKKVINVSVSASVIEVSSVSVNLPTVTLAPGKNQAITLTINPSDASVTSIEWSSDNAAVATVDANGVITAVAPGNAKITVTVKTPGATKTAQIDVTVQAVLVTSITLDQSTLALNLASLPTTLYATVKPDDATNPAIEWTSDNTSAVTVSQAGVVSVVGLGTANVKVTAKDASGKSAICVVTVSNVDPTAVNLDSTSVTLAVGKNVTLKATIDPSNAPQGVDWSIANTTFATVNANGTITALKAGSTTITATSQAKNTVLKTINLTIVSIPVSTITVDQTSLSLNLASLPVTLKATVKPDDATDKGINWSSSDTKVVTVTGGVVTVVGVGSATITATAADGSGKSIDIPVTVSNVDPASVTLDQTPITLIIGQSKTLLASVLPANAPQGITWTSSDPTIATVDADGIVTAKKDGSVTITAASQAKSTVLNTVSVTVNKKAVTGISINKTDVTVNDKGSTAIVEATIEPTDATYKDVVWTSADPSIATVANGIITGVAEGSTIVTVKSVDNNTIVKTINVTVTHVTTIINVASVDLDKKTLSLEVGSSDQLTATVLPGNATDPSITYTSSDETIATVDATGKVTAVKAGQATIKVTTKDGSFESSCIVTVSDIALKTITFNPATATVKSTSTIDLSKLIVFSPANAADKSVNWSVDASQSSLGSVNISTGVFTPSVSTGIVTVTATNLKTGLKATIDVTINTDIVSVTGVVVTPNTKTITLTQLKTSEILNLSAEVFPTDATVNTVTWSSSNPSVASVDTKGVVTVQSESSASATISATSNNGKTGSCLITVLYKYEITSLTMNTLPTSINQQAALQMDASIVPQPAAAGKTIAWSIDPSSTSVGATISSSGLLTSGTTDGTIKVIATVTDFDGDVFTKSVDITVKNVVPLQSITVNDGNSTLTLNKAETKTITVVYNPSNTDQTGVSYSSSDPSVVSVTNSGIMTAVKGGQATITVIPSADPTLKKTFTVTVVELVSAIDVAVGNTTIKVGSSADVKVTIDEVSASNKTVTVTVSDPTVASIVKISNTDYSLVGLKAGSVTIKVTATDGSGVEATSNLITVQNVDVTQISINASSNQLEIGKSIVLAANITPANATIKTVKWSTSASNIVSVDQTGKITAIAEGEATITVVSDDNSDMTSNITITVVNKAVIVDSLQATYDQGFAVLKVASQPNSGVQQPIIDYLFSQMSQAQKIINKYNNDPTSVTQEQVDAANEALKLAIAQAKCNCYLATEYVESSVVVVYPNPVVDQMTVKGCDDIKSVEVVDVRGLVVARSQSEKVDVSSIPAGIYTVLINNGKEVVVKFMLKQ